MKLTILSILLLFAGGVWALEPCPDNQQEKWDNCTGTFTYPSGNEYVGEWKDAKRHGQGTYTDAYGDKYVGEWKDGKRHGQGTYARTWKPTFKQKRAAKRRMKHEQGTYFSRRWEYVGGYKDGKRHGQGTYTDLYGDKYVGEWKDGKRTGQGTYYTTSYYSPMYNQEYEEAPNYKAKAHTNNNKREAAAVSGYDSQSTADKEVIFKCQSKYSYRCLLSHQGMKEVGEESLRAYREELAEARERKEKRKEIEAKQLILTALFDRCSQFGWISDDDINACMKQEAYGDFQMQLQQYEMMLLEERLIGATTPQQTPFFLDILSLYAQHQQIKQTKQMQKDIQRLKASNRSMRSRQNTQRALKSLYQGRGD